MRQYIINELIETEKIFIENLKIVIEVFASNQAATFIK